VTIPAVIADIVVADSRDVTAVCTVVEPAVVVILSARKSKK